MPVAPELETEWQTAVFRPIPSLNAVTVGMPSPGYTSLITGTAQAGTAPASDFASSHTVSTVTLAAGASGVDNAYRGMAIRITSGAGSGARGTITGYVGSTKIAAVSWGTGANGPTGIPSVAIDATSGYELSIECSGKQKVIAKVEYGNATCTATLSIALRDQNGLVIDTDKVVPDNLGTNDLGTVGYRGRALEVPVDGFDTGLVQVEVAAAGGVTPSVTVWATAV